MIRPPDGIALARVKALVVWSVVTWVVVFWRLGYTSLLDPDEAHYAQLTHEMIQSGNWLVPVLDGQPYIDKPVLFHWLQAAAVMALGESEFALRLPSALAALSLIATTRWLGARLFGAPVGTWAALMLVTTPITFALARIGMIDMVFTAFLFGGIACLIAAAVAPAPRVEYSGYVLIALATMTKGPVALVLVALFLGSALCSGRAVRTAVRTLHWRVGLAIACLAGSPWFVWMWVAFGDRFVRDYVLNGNLFYFTQPLSFSARITSYGFYPRIFLTAFFPWSILVIGLLIDNVLRRGQVRVPVAAGLLWRWMLVVMVFFSAARFRLDHYIFPAAPACCLLAFPAQWDPKLGIHVT